MIVRVGLGINTQGTEVVRTTQSTSYQLSVPVRVRKVVNVDTDGSGSDIYTKHPNV